MMHVDDGRRIARYESLGEDLHVTGENDQIDVERLKQCELGSFGFSTCGRSDRNVFEANAVKGGEPLDFTVIGYDDSDLTRQLAGSGAMQQVGDAVQIVGTEDGNAWAAASAMQLPVHLKLVGERGEFAGEDGETFMNGVALDRIAFQSPLHTHEEEAQLVILMLVGVKDVGALRVEQAGDASHQAFPVRAVDEQDCAVAVLGMSFAGGCLKVRHRLQII
jgi:hypothetical protein